MSMNGSMYADRLKSDFNRSRFNLTDELFQKANMTLD